MNRVWYAGVHLEWVETLIGYMQITADMVEGTALADDGTYVPGWVQSLRDEAVQMEAYVSGKCAKTKRAYAEDAQT